MWRCRRAAADKSLVTVRDHEKLGGGAGQQTTMQTQAGDQHHSHSTLFAAETTTSVRLHSRVKWRQKRDWTLTVDLCLCWDTNCAAPPLLQNYGSNMVYKLSINHDTAGSRPRLDMKGICTID